MPKPKVFVTRVIPDAGLDKVKSLCDAEIWTDPLPPPREILMQKASECEGLLSLLTDRVDGPLLDRAPGLRVVSNYAVGYNNIDVDAATKRGVAVGNTPDVLTDATADMAFCLMIAASRRLLESNAYLRDGKWKTWEPLGHIGQDLVGRTLGVLGMGRIGYGLARRCHRGWDMRILYTDVYQNGTAERELGARRVDFDTLLGESDFVSVHTVLSPETRGLFDAAAFKKMKSTAIFINTARGPIHVKDDLGEALRTGEIFAAGLDVTNPEPLPVDDPVLALPNLIITPHIASATVTSRNAMAEIAADNLIAGVRGEPLRAWVNPEVSGKRRT
jgi:glyoxylate reductase